MTTPLRVLGDARSLALAGGPSASRGTAPAVHLGDPIVDPEPGDFIWCPGPAVGPTAGTRMIATGGEGLWSRAPWPARDELFELAPPAEPRALVVGPDEERRADVVEKLEARGRSVSEADLLTATDLAAASVVALTGEADAATGEAPWGAAAMPAEAPAVLAARRILIAPRCAVSFGLLPGVDHLAAGTGDDVVHYADMVLTTPESFEPLRVLGAVAAERHRASLVYARLGAEL
jgi:hypothetical protein